MINEDLDSLFEDWKVQMEANGEPNFCTDGVIRQLGKEEVHWLLAKRKVVFLLKEPWSSNLTDIREWSGQMDPTAPEGFYDRISAWLYGINKATPTSYPDLETAFYPKIQLKALRNYAHAFVHIKKCRGENKAYDSEIYNYAQQYKDFLKEQLEILEPNIVVCCGQISFRVVDEVLYDQQLIEVNDWIFVHTQSKTIFINAFEPTASKKNYQMYDWMMERLIKTL